MSSLKLTNAQALLLGQKENTKNVASAVNVATVKGVEDAAVSEEQEVWEEDTRLRLTNSQLSLAQLSITRLRDLTRYHDLTFPFTDVAKPRFIQLM